MAITPGGHMRDQRGSATLELVLALPLLVMAMGLLSLVTWPERQNAAASAAYEASKAVVTADDTDEGMALGRQKAQETMANHGYPSSLVDVTYTGSLERGAAVTAEVTVRLPALSIPLVGTLASREFSRSNTQRVADYRGFR